MTRPEPCRHRRPRLLPLLLHGVAIIGHLASGLDNGQFRTPPMGLLTWERFRCITDCEKWPDDCISEHLFTTLADAMKSKGFLDAGYDFVNVDDCWSEMTRDGGGDGSGSADGGGNLRADKKRFPRGMKYVSDYLHSAGFKFGLYTDVGPKTCAGYPGSGPDHFEIDSKLFREWGVDSIKVDGCNVHDTGAYPALYEQFSGNLTEHSPDTAIYFSWPAYVGPTAPLGRIAESANAWRNYRDIQDSWSSVVSIVTYWADQQDALAAVHGPGSLNDPDMLIVGNYGLSVPQARTQMALWCMYAAPLLMSADVRRDDMSDEYVNILLNRHAIAVNQDPLVAMGRRVKNVTDGGYLDGQWTWWYTKPLADGNVALAIWREFRGGADTEVYTSFSDIGVVVPGGNDCGGGREEITVLDVWNGGSVVGTYCDGFSTRIAPHDTHFFILAMNKTQSETMEAIAR